MPGTWQGYEALCDSQGDSSIPRIKYCPGEILLMSLLLKHGRDAHIAALVNECFESVSQQGTRMTIRALRQRLSNHESV